MNIKGANLAKFIQPALDLQFFISEFGIFSIGICLFLADGGNPSGCLCINCLWSEPEGNTLEIGALYLAYE